MLDFNKGEELCKLIDDKIYLCDYYGLINYYIDVIDGIIYLFVFDKDGNVVVIIILINK